MSDNIAVLEGFTREVHATGMEHELFLLVKPGTDLGERFKAWDMDAQEFVHVNGWNFTCEEVAP